VHPEAHNVARWSGSADPGEVQSTTLCWQPPGMTEPFVLDLPSFVDDVLR